MTPLALDEDPARLFALGNTLLAAGQVFEAADRFLTCIRRAPRFGGAYVNLSAALRRLGVLDDAYAMASAGLALLPDAAEAKLALANVLHDRAEYAAAASVYWQVIQHAPGHAGALSSLGNTLAVVGQMQEAVAAHDRAAALAPGDPAIRFNRATTLLAAGDFARGWVDYEARLEGLQRPSHISGPAWDGADLAGRTILLHAEQGFGDTLQFVRYAPMVAARGGRVVLAAQPPLVRLLRATDGVVETVSSEALPAFDTHAPLLSLPRIFATELATIPAACPYLRVDQDLAQDWRNRLPPAPGLRVGVVWAGASRPGHSVADLMDKRRSIPPDIFAALGGVPGVQFVSLQKPALAGPSGLDLVDPMPDVADFADTAAIIATLDLVISVDTAVAHLAGGLGVPVWLLSRYDGCWRWLRGRTDSPWYPRMRIFRQPAPGDWRTVLEEVRQALSKGL